MIYCHYQPGQPILYNRQHLWILCKCNCVHNCQLYLVVGGRDESLFQHNSLTISDYIKNLTRSQALILRQYHEAAFIHERSISPDPRGTWI